MAIRKPQKEPVKKTVKKQKKPNERLGFKNLVIKN